MEAEPARVRIERRERRGPADVGHPGLVRGQAPGEPGNDTVRNAQEGELAVLAHRHAALLEPRGDRRADSAATDHVDAFEHLQLQFRSGYRANAV